jgi:hypothetical protein
MKSFVVFNVLIFRKPAEVSFCGANVVENAKLTFYKKGNAWRSARDPVRDKLLDKRNQETLHTHMAGIRIIENG